MATREPRQTSGLSVQRKPSPEFVEALGMELAILAETLHFQVTENMMIGFLEGLKDLPFPVIRLGFRRALRSSIYPPKPKEIREWGVEEFERHKPQYQPAWGVPPTPAEKAQDKETWAKLCKQFGWKE